MALCSCSSGKARSYIEEQIKNWEWWVFIYYFATLIFTLIVSSLLLLNPLYLLHEYFYNQILALGLSYFLHISCLFCLCLFNYSLHLGDSQLLAAV